MDKQKVKIILIALAVLLAIFLLYRVASKASDNKLDLANKKANANADLAIQKELDEYAEEKRKQIKEEADELAALLSEKQKAQGIDDLSELYNSMTKEEQAEYDSLASDYVSVFKTSPGLMSLVDLRKWSAKYQKWQEYNAEYMGLTSNGTVFFDYMDDPEALRAEILSARTAIDDAWNNAWRDECEYFHSDVKVGDYDALIAVPANAISDADLARFFAHPSDIASFHRVMTGKYVTYTTERIPKIESYWQELKQYLEHGYIKWKNSSKNFVRGANDISDSLFDHLWNCNTNDFAYFKRRLLEDGGVNMFTRVDTFNAPHDKKNFTNFYDAVMNVANFQQQYEGKTNPVWAALSLGASAAIQKNNKVREFLPDRLKRLMRMIELGSDQSYSNFGVTLENMVSELSNYSWTLYGFPDWFWNELESKKVDINEWVNSDNYKKSPYYQNNQERIKDYTPSSLL